MITPENITRKQAKKLVKLVEEETRCEIMARFGRFDNLEYADYARKEIEIKEEIQKMLFGTCDMVELGKMWKMLKIGDRKKIHGKRKKK